MDWVSIAEEFVGSAGWGARGKLIGVSRMMSPSDVDILRTNNIVASYRPRGILSGFLAVVPSLGYAVYLPPVASKLGPFRIRMRLSSSLCEHGAIFSVYLPNSREKQIVIEDLLMWMGQPVWQTMPFAGRWKLLQSLADSHWTQDNELQDGYNFTFSEYVMLGSLNNVEDHQVLEFVPSAPNTKRLIWSPSRTAPTPVAATHVASSGDSMTVRREAALGPDVYSVWNAGAKVGMALVRTLAVSRALRLATTEDIRVRVSHNKQFEKYEVVDVM
jgi:hypothetical protein